MRDSSASAFVVLLGILLGGNGVEAADRPKKHAKHES